MTESFSVLTDDKLKRYTETELALAHAKELLKVAKCPNAHCVDGVISEGYADEHDHFQCQFCYERELMLKPREGE